MITSVANRSWPGDIMGSDLPAAGLPASIVCPAKERVIQLGFIVPLLHIRFPGGSILQPARRFPKGYGRKNAFKRRCLRKHDPGFCRDSERYS